MGITERESERNLAKLSNHYPGRITGIGLSPNSRYWWLFAGMGGRSSSSNNRYYRLHEDMNGHGPFLKTELHDPEGVKGDAATTLYIAQRQRRGWHVVGNGEQVEGISISLATKKHVGDMVTVDFERGQALYLHEGSTNGNTARITAAVHISQIYPLIGKVLRDRSDYAKSVYKTYSLISYDGFDLYPGEGYFTTTYDGAGEMEPNYDKPYRILLPDSLEEWGDQIWEGWRYNKAGLFGEEVDRKTGAFRFVTKSIHEGRGFSTDFVKPTNL